MEHSDIYMEHSYILVYTLIMNLKIDPNNLHISGVGNQDTVAYRWIPARKYMCKYTHWCVTQSIYTLNIFTQSLELVLNMLV